MLAYTAITCLVMAFLGHFALALPPVADIPEEILRTQIITSARSPIDGKLLTAAEYAELQAKLRVAPPPKLNPKVRETIFLLRLRNLLMRVFPFIDI
ncbi:hypothetical protein RintRC_1360 [Richelia intracellularis]|nr:hypothetical protein RintRC_1360 [Richelia intracellularis]